MSADRFHIVSLMLVAASITALTDRPATGQIIDQIAPDDTTNGNYFGTSVAIDGTFALIGATGAHSCGENAGAAFIFERGEFGHWTETARLSPENCAAGLFFGKEVALSGNRAAVAAYVPFFSGAASNEVHLYHRDEATGTWNLTQTIRQPPGRDDGVFGTSISLDGDRLLVTAGGSTGREPSDGAAYLYQFRDGMWSLASRLTGSLGVEAGVFGASGSLDGDRVAIAASTYFNGNPGSVYIFDRDSDTGAWVETGILRGILDFFISVDVDGDRVLVGESKAGSDGTGRARLFERQASGKWRALQTLLPRAKQSHGSFGEMVALQGDRALVVGFDEQLQLNINIDRVVYVFERDTDSGEWRQKHKVDLGNVEFGSDIDLSDDLAVIGQAPEAGPGKAYIVTLN